MNKLDVRTRDAWRKWLAENHARETEIWLVFHKKHTGVSSVPYEAAVEEALCFGWIDSLIKRLDERRYARKFTPRTSGSAWPDRNKARAEKMIKEGRMTDAGLKLIAAAKSNGQWQETTSRIGSDLSADHVPEELAAAFAEFPMAEKQYRDLPPSCRKQYVIWIASAKRAETRSRRAREAVDMLDRGERLGMK